MRIGFGKSLYKSTNTRMSSTSSAFARAFFRSVYVFCAFFIVTTLIFIAVYSFLVLPKPSTFFLPKQDYTPTLQTQPTIDSFNQTEKHNANSNPPINLSSSTFQREYVKEVKFEKFQKITVVDTSHKIGGQLILPFCKDIILNVLSCEPVKFEHIFLSNDTVPRLIGEMSDAMISEMFLHAWSNYAFFTYGQNELKPISLLPNSNSIMGANKLGLTIVDSLDTLFMMDLHDEFDQAEVWLQSSFNLNQVAYPISVFETNIRYLGGFLSAYVLSNRQIFLDKAIYIAEILLHAFQDDKTFPCARIIPASFSCYPAFALYLAEIGTLHMEFALLSHFTNNSIYLNKAKKIRNQIEKLKPKTGLYPQKFRDDSSTLGNFETVGGGSDSFFEYLLKTYIMSGQNDEQGLRMFDQTFEVISSRLVNESHGKNLFIHSSERFNEMEHLTCFYGGTVALRSLYTTNETQKKMYIDFGDRIAETCYKSYTSTLTNLGPESFIFSETGEIIPSLNAKFYILRPETIETLFYMWRLTKEQKYRDWAWNITQALNKVTRVTNGFSGIKDVKKIKPAIYNDVQESFFLAETLKYLYLIFSDDENFYSLKSWVFNTEAHPFPIDNRIRV